MQQADLEKRREGCRDLAGIVVLNDFSLQLDKFVSSFLSEKTLLELSWLFFTV